MTGITLHIQWPLTSKSLRSGFASSGSEFCFNDPASGFSAGVTHLKVVELSLTPSVLIGLATGEDGSPELLQRGAVVSHEVDVVPENSFLNEFAPGGQLFARGVNIHPFVHHQR
jgi:hypothetical protein